MTSEYRFASQDAIYLLLNDSFSRTDIELLTPQRSGVYIQYVKDSDDNLLVDGFFRENMRDRVLPPDVNRVIATYYSKSYSFQSLHEELTTLGMVKSFCLPNRSDFRFGHVMTQFT